MYQRKITNSIKLLHVHVHNPISVPTRVYSIHVKETKSFNLEQLQSKYFACLKFRTLKNTVQNKNCLKYFASICTCILVPLLSSGDILTLHIMNFTVSIVLTAKSMEGACECMRKECV